MESALHPASAPERELPRAVEIRDLVHRYGDREALRGVSFAIAQGEILAVLGPNGSGKSTLFRILSTLIPPTGGEVRLFGRGAGEDVRAAREKLGVVFQSPSLDPLLTARENMVHQGHLYGLRGADLTGRIDALLSGFDLADRARDRVHGFSGGMRRRLEIAKALLHRPRLLILDEPSTGLDPGARRDLWHLVTGLRAEHGVTVVFTTHLLDEAEHADRVAILDRGLLVALDDPESLKTTVGGDVITLECEAPAELAEGIRDRFGLEASASEGRVRIERERGHEFLPRLVEAYTGAIRAASVRKPDLDDVFLHLTGRRLVDAEEEQ